MSAMVAVLTNDMALPKVDSPESGSQTGDETKPGAGLIFEDVAAHGMCETSTEARKMLEV